MRPNALIVEGAIKQGLIDNALRMYGVHTSYCDDLRQEIALTLLCMDNDRLNDIYEDGKLPAFIGRIVRNQWHSKTSDFFRKYRRNEQTSYTPEVWNIANKD